MSTQRVGGGAEDAFREVSKIIGRRRQSDPQRQRSRSNQVKRQLNDNLARFAHEALEQVDRQGRQDQRRAVSTAGRTAGTVDKTAVQLNDNGAAEARLRARWLRLGAVSLVAVFVVVLVAQALFADRSPQRLALQRYAAAVPGDQQGYPDRTRAINQRTWQQVAAAPVFLQLDAAEFDVVQVVRFDGLGGWLREQLAGMEWQPRWQIWIEAAGRHQAERFAADIINADPRMDALQVQARLAAALTAAGIRHCRLLDLESELTNRGVFGDDMELLRRLLCEAAPALRERVLAGTVEEIRWSSFRSDDALALLDTFDGYRVSGPVSVRGAVASFVGPGWEPEWRVLWIEEEHDHAAAHPF